jgi:hypothetical protein
MRGVKGDRVGRNLLNFLKTQPRMDGNQRESDAFGFGEWDAWAMI